MMRRALLCATGLLAAGAAQAQEVKLTPSAEMRLRYEHVDQDGLPRDANAVTLRVRPGLAASWKGWSALVEAEGVVALADGYNDGTNGRTRYPLVVDPENIELNRAQLRYAGKDGLAVTAGRQRLNFADDRFVGNAPSNMARRSGRASTSPMAGTYAPSTVATAPAPGRHRSAATMSSRSSAMAPGRARSAASPIWSTRTMRRCRASACRARPGACASPAGRRSRSMCRSAMSPAGRGRAIGAATPIAMPPIIGWASCEVLGAGTGVALTSVQTPLASYFKFNGWAGKFGTTPPGGLRDLYATLGYGWKQVGPLDAINLGATWHRFGSDRLGQHYGDELDLVVGVKRGHYALSARYAHYRADRFATDTDKFWLQLDWSL
jgi:hypothetical protein